MEKIKCNIVLSNELENQLSQLREMERKLPQEYFPKASEKFSVYLAHKRAKELISYKINKIESDYES
jgi:hypothetical protein